MPLPHYGVLKAHPVNRRLGSGRNPYYQILAVDEHDRYRVAVNVKSKLPPSELEYLIAVRSATLFGPLPAPLDRLRVFSCSNRVSRISDR